MPSLTIRKSDRSTSATFGAATLDALRAGLRGPLCLPGEPGYDAARTLWNAMIDRRPAAVVRAAGAADVIRTVSFARENRLLLSVRGGGHNVAGNAACDDGLMLDLSLMRSVRVDPSTRSARVEPGALLGDFDHEAQAFGLAAPLGINTSTGVAGLTLGGGFGWLSRSLGLAADNLISADVVTAEGRMAHAAADEHPDLFWALRGGGGNFGVVTSFEFRLHPVGPEVLAGVVVHPLAAAREVLEGYRRCTAEAPEGLTCWVMLRKAPPLPFLPPEVHGTPVLILALCGSGDLEEGKKAAAPFRALGRPIADAVGPVPFVRWQANFDPLLAAGARNYWKAHDFEQVSDPLIGVLLDYASRLPGPGCVLNLGHLGGAVRRVAPDATAYPHRDADYFVNVHGRWMDPGQDAACMAWARGAFEAMAPHATGGVYVNFMSEDETARVRSGAYGANYARLAKVKAAYDPENLFRMNQNIRPDV